MDELRLQLENVTFFSFDLLVDCKQACNQRGQEGSPVLHPPPTEKWHF